MNSKVVSFQIVPAYGSTIPGLVMCPDLIALCEDGSLWIRPVSIQQDHKWTRLTPVLPPSAPKITPTPEPTIGQTLHEPGGEAHCIVEGYYPNTKDAELHALLINLAIGTTNGGNPIQNGDRCSCGGSMFDSSPNIVLSSYPPKKNVHCEKCGFRGYRVVP